MNDYRKKIIDTVLNDPMFRSAADDLSDDQKEKIKKVLEQFVDTFSMSLFRTFTAAASAQNMSNQKSIDNMSGSVITREND